MGLIKYNVSPTNKSLDNFIDEFFNDGFGKIFGSDFAVNQPAINVIEDKEGFRLEVAAPGLEKEDFEIKVEKNYLTVSANVEETKEETKYFWEKTKFQFLNLEHSKGLAVH